jgi:glycosyltransferase involved in cell wall biosynthesis
MKTLALILAYNEEKTILDVIEETKIDLPEADILVVNDGSTDKTKALLAGRKDIIVLHHPFNMGIGGAIWTGFNFFSRNEYEYLVRIDGDGQHPPSQARKLLEPLIKQEADLVIGSRFIRREGYLSSLGRRGGIKLLNILTAFLLKQKITDNTSGFRAYSRRAVRLLAEDYPFDYPEPIEVYILSRQRFKIMEISARMRQREGGVTSIRLTHTYYYLVKVLLTILVNFLYGGKK